MKNYLKTFLLGIGAGAAIGLGSLLFTISASFSNKILGSFLFAVGLFTVCILGLFLYTGKIGFWLDNKTKKAYSIQLLVGYLGNIVGAVGLGYLSLLIFKFINPDLISAITKIVASRMIDLGNGGSPLFIQLGSSFYCGALVYIAVQFFKKPWNLLIRTVILVLAVFLFVYSGFEHCIANMYYFSLGNSWNLQSIVNILIVTIGNSLGALFVRFVIISR